LTWILLSLGVAVFYALHGAWSTRVSREVGPLVAGWTLFTFALPFLVANLVVRGLPVVDPGFWPVWVANTLLNFGASYLFLSALRLGELGVTYPLLALTPFFVVPLEFLLLGEVPGPFGLLGVLMVVVGVYLLNMRSAGPGLLAPLRALLHDSGALRMLSVAVLWSVSGTLDRVAVLHSSPAFYAGMLTGGLALLYLPVVIIAARRPWPSGSGGQRWPVGWVAFVHGLLFAAMLILQMEALTLALASYVLSIKRSGAVLAVVLGFLVFRERSLGPRLAGALVTVLGAGVLVAFG
jgi:drug/metabolite transporter (DMT)-like permease